MKFDYIIGNPPYQDDRQENGMASLPIYHQFMASSYEIGQAVEMITPASFLWNEGRTPKGWNQQMLEDPHLKVVEYDHDANGNDANPAHGGKDNHGEVVITFRDASKQFDAIRVFTPNETMNQILAKVRPFWKKGTLSSCFLSAAKWNKNKLSMDYPHVRETVRRVMDRDFAGDCFHEEKEEGDVLICGIENGVRQKKWISPSYMDGGESFLDGYKIMMPKTDGKGKFGAALTQPEILSPGSGFTNSFFGIGVFQSIEEAKAAQSYMKTKFVRSLLGVRKNKQDMNAEKLSCVPIQNFTSSSQINWTESISQIDQQLYRIYGLNEDEISLIESHVQAME